MRLDRCLQIIMAAVTLLACGRAFAHVFIPPGCPKGGASQGGRLVSAEVSGGRLALGASRDANADDTSVHFLWCWDEGLDTELMWAKSTGTISAQKAQASVSVAIPAGVHSVHYVIMYDHGDPSTYTWGSDGVIKGL